jgi:muramoyltetrapeptide carboxypeptidase
MSSNGKTIAAISPSGIHDPILLNKSIQMVESWGHTVVCSENHNALHLYTAGTVTQRIKDLQWALHNPDIDIIWFIRGGYGCAQLLPQLDDMNFSKPIIGFSDATALLAYLWNRKIPVGFHGPVLHSLESLCDERSQLFIKDFLFSGFVPQMQATYYFGPIHSVKAPVIGGNLCVLASLCGTPYQLRTEGCILALEDIQEPAYKIDRLLHQLEQSGMFDNIAGILLGSFHKCHVPSEVDWSLDTVFRHRLEHLNIPVYYKAKFGHNEINWIWKVGSKQILEPYVD